MRMLATDSFNLRFPAADPSRARRQDGAAGAVSDTLCDPGAKGARARASLCSGVINGLAISVVLWAGLAYGVFSLLR